MRNPIRFGPNQHSAQNYCLTRYQQNAEGEIIQKVLNRITVSYGDHYAAACKIK